jgi:CheY-like chemotaxis protein
LPPRRHPGTLGPSRRRGTGRWTHRTAPLAAGLHSRPALIQAAEIHWHPPSPVCYDRPPYQSRSWVPIDADLDARPVLSALVVESQPEAAHSLAQLIRHEGYDVRLARTSADALRAAAEQPPDVVLVDTDLPDVDGYELAKRLRARVPDRPMLVVAMTDGGGGDELARLRQSGVALHFLKPVDPEQLTDAIRLYRRIRPAGAAHPAPAVP